MSYTYSQVYHEATGKEPFPYQIRLAESETFPDVIKVPTGLGKTSAVVLAWAWRRFFTDYATRSRTPRRLVYCLPMRTLVEQTKANVDIWLSKLENAFKIKRPEVIILMGGEDKVNWDIYPENDAIIIGTQDMLLSRALNRGYSMSKYRWSVHFGLLNNDCLWVLDEVQLMGVGAKTGTQLHEFRLKYGTMLPSHTIRMSATIDESSETNDSVPFELQENDYQDPIVNKRVSAKKSLNRLDEDKIVDSIIQDYSNGKKVILIINTVKQAIELYKNIKSKLNKDKDSCILLHSRFRPPEKEKIRERLFNNDWNIVVSTQVIEAGVDITSDSLYTELAPWSSMVQRFGRCNRNGESDDANIYWFKFNDKKTDAPYTKDEIDDAMDKVTRLTSASPDSIKAIPLESPKIVHVIRGIDIIDLFDTNSDLSGNEIDISRFIRDSDDRDVNVFWRDVSDAIPDMLSPSREEICHVPIQEFKRAAERDSWKSWVWDYLEGKWIIIKKESLITPNSLIVISSESGGYDPEFGWDIPESTNKVTVAPINIDLPSSTNDSYGQNQSIGKYESIAEHTENVCTFVNNIASCLELNEIFRDALYKGALWHDVGKAHPEFQNRIKVDVKATGEFFAKAPHDKWNSGGRKLFRHELASALCALQNGADDLVAFLVAAHHGKIRLSIRSLPNEKIPEDERLFARDVWDGDIIPDMDLNGLKVPETKIDLSYMKLGEGPRGESWSSRMLALRDRDDIGIFRLAYLEALLKAADERASMGDK